LKDQLRLSTYDSTVAIAVLITLAVTGFDSSSVDFNQ